MLSKKAPDPSSCPLPGLLKWNKLLSDACFTVTHSECLDKEIEFETWVQRMCSKYATAARLKEMLLT
jgi:hypothetical protein